ncbi:MAG: hypothetical protein JXR03_03850 [Cyclobacteriaceae bacterium]
MDVSIFGLLYQKVRNESLLTPFDWYQVLSKLLTLFDDFGDKEYRQHLLVVWLYTISPALSA